MSQIILTMNIRLSIIVPVYNVEKYVRSCIESIYRQGLEEEDFEVIIINDGTKDHSMEVIQDLVSQHQNITIVHQENQGLSVVRNNGIARAKGDYILMPDSDDLLIDNSLPKLLEAALQSRADLIVADFIKMDDEDIKQAEGVFPQRNEFQYKEKTGEQLFLEDLNPHHCYVWRTLYRREFLLDNNIKFFPGIYIQDVPFTHECYLKAKKCLRTSWLLNIYRLGHESATFCFNMRKEKNFCTAIAKTWELTQMHGLTSEIKNRLQNNVYTSFSVMLCSTSHAIKSASERVEIIDYLRQIAPDLKFNNDFKQRMATFMYRNMPHTYIHLRYYYGLIVEDKILPFYYHKLKKVFR